MCVNTCCFICVYVPFYNVDFILTYEDNVSKKDKEDTDEKREKRKAKREKFLESCVELGLEYEVQDCKVCGVVYKNPLHRTVHILSV